MKSALDRYVNLVHCMKEVICSVTPGKIWDEDNAKVRNKSENGVVKERRKNNPKSWWDNECVEVVKIRKNMLVKFKRTRDMKDYIEFKKARAVARKTINIKKKRDFVDFVQSINRFSSMKFVWNKIRVMKHPCKTIE